MPNRVSIRNGHTGLLTFPRFGLAAAECARSYVMRNGRKFFEMGLPYPQRTYVRLCDHGIIHNHKIIVSVSIGWY